MRERQFKKARAKEDRARIVGKEPVKEWGRRGHEQHERRKSDNNRECNYVGAPHQSLPAITMSSI
jgi:hypothetical protein